MDENIMQKIRPGAKVRVWERIKEKDKERQSAFEGIVIARKHGKEAGATFTVRTVLHDVGVEKVFPIHSPMLAKVDVLSSPKKVHKAKLYYLRGFSSNKTRERLKA